MGHHADVMSDGCGHMKLSTDIYLKREPGVWGGAKYLYNLFELLPKLKDYDVVQLINTNFLSLKPQRIKYFFDRIKEQNKSVFLTLAGNDYYYCKACHDAKIFRFSEFKVGNEFTPAHKANPELLYGWLSHTNKQWSEYLMSNIAGAMAVLPEYEMAIRNILGEKVAFTNLPVDLTELPSSPEPFQNDKVNILVGVRSGCENMKGSKTLVSIAKEIEKKMPEKVMLQIARDLSLKDFLNSMAKSDIVIDQLYSYSPAMTALYAMSMGKVVGTGAQPEYYEYIGNPESRPLLTLSPLDNDIEDRIISLVNDRESILKLGKESKEIVLKYNDSKVVTRKFLDHWNNFN